jgi:hypothetical protein
MCILVLEHCRAGLYTLVVFLVLLVMLNSAGRSGVTACVMGLVFPDRILEYVAIVAG